MPVAPASVAPRAAMEKYEAGSIEGCVPSCFSACIDGCVASCPAGGIEGCVASCPAGNIEGCVTTCPTTTQTPSGGASSSAGSTT